MPQMQNSLSMRPRPKATKNAAKYLNNKIKKRKNKIKS